MTALPPSLDSSCFLDIFQSILLSRTRNQSLFPTPPMARNVFARKRRSELCGLDEWRNAARDLATMFMLTDSPDAEKTLDARQDIPMGERAERLRLLWLRSPRNLAFSTSGSTGEPRLCVHTETDLQQEAACLMNIFAGKKAFLSAVPPHHLYGFTFGLYLPFLCGVPVERTLSLSSLVISRTREDCAVVGVPLLWDAVARGQDHPSPKNVTLISASAPARPETLAALERRGYAIADIFGSSETGVMGIRRRADAPYRLLPYFSRLKENPQQLLRAMPDGDVVACPLMDNLRWQNDREFYPEGRTDRAVQVGGVNVYPALIEKRLTAVPGVATCAVRLMTPKEGSRLKAFIVAEKNADEAALRKTLKALFHAMPPEERPARLDFGPELPRNDMGKLKDW